MAINTLFVVNRAAKNEQWDLPHSVHATYASAVEMMNRVNGVISTLKVTFDIVPGMTISTIIEHLANNNRTMIGAYDDHDTAFAAYTVESKNIWIEEYSVY